MASDRIVPPIPFPLAPSPVLPAPANDTRAPALVLAPPPPKGKAHARSVQHHVGDANEQLVAGLNETCRLAGVAFVHKVPEPLKVVGPPTVGKYGRTFPAVFMHRSECPSGVDYLGVMLDGSARAVAVEAKRCADGRFDLVRDVTPAQVHELNYYTLAGAVAVLLVIYGPRRLAYPLPWHAVCHVRAPHDSEFPEPTIRPDQLTDPAPLHEPYLRRFARTPGGAR